MDNERRFDNVDDLSRQIASEKNLIKHVVEQREFQNPAYGPVLDVKNKEDLQTHVRETLVSEKTECFRSDEEFQKGTLFFYNRDTNTFIVVPGDDRKEPSVYRPKEHEEKFQQKFKSVSDRQLEEKGCAPEIKHGIYELVPELAREQPQITKDFTATSQELTTPKARISEAVPSMPEIAGTAGRVAGKAEHVVMEVGEAVLDAASELAMWLEAALGGASRKAPGGAEYTPLMSADPSRAAPTEKSQTQKDREFLGKQDENAHRDANVKDVMTRSPIAIDASLTDRVRRDQEKATRDRDELYRDDWEPER